jgi:hypothetical protein
METQLYLPQPAGVGATAMPMNKSSALANPNLEQLRAIRRGTCYRTLRFVIDIGFMLAASLIVGYVILAMIGYVRMGFSLGSMGGNMVALAITALAAGIAIVLLYAAYQATVLLIDIADCSIRLVQGQETQLLVPVAQPMPPRFQA